ncbi:MAG: DUF2325 domain-containing protein [Oscillospiraceae bacterium]|jgi:hypothetical protein|nr:DUF2325 domain-containing protein [Oscillospiraceae bacterium]
MEKNTDKSIVIIGGFDRLACRYKDICAECGFASKVFTKPKANMHCLIGNPDLIVLITNPVSHEMTDIVRRKAMTDGITLIQSHRGSCSALREVLSRGA